MIRALARRTWVHVAVGALLMGAWAVFANRMHPMAERLQAGVVQAVLSGTLTALLKTVADHLRLHLPHWSLAAGITFVLSAALLLKVHAMAGTPEIGPTVAVPLAVSGTYVFAYSYLRATDA
ncbi:hypothetical protein [Jannaschia donghaensis]|uniref:Uncharacterized protein n=1 Tax=Jannaschia donghaensis TaxID=420998 RepID=A0A0M6YJ02_9RHOB|nr:hypothetical protein [Jannaschia donghaensis]CTQ49257.1 hypothetical protein JDO7802_01270 [Jannaschia donghaensis]